MYQGKVDLHLHLDGSLNPELVQKLAQEQGMHLSLEETKARMRVSPDCTSLVEYLSKFELAKQVLQTSENLERATYELVERLAKQGLIYAEIRFAPQLHLQKGLTMPQVVDSVLRGAEQAQRDYPTIRVGILLCALVGAELNKETFDLAKDYIGKGVVGVDIAGAEGSVPMTSYEPLFADMRLHQIPFTIHAGETGLVQNPRIAVEMGASRIGHGCAAIHDEQVMALLRREKTVVEACVVSNLHTKAVPSLAQHPIEHFFRTGIHVTVNTDNMACSDTTLAFEHETISKAFAFTDEDYRTMDRYAIEGAFIPDAEKKLLLAKL